MSSSTRNRKLSSHPPFKLSVSHGLAYNHVRVELLFYMIAGVFVLVIRTVVLAAWQFQNGGINADQIFDALLGLFNRRERNRWLGTIMVWPVVLALDLYRWLRR